MEIARPAYAYAGFGVRNPIKALPALHLVGEASNVPAVNALWHSHPYFEFVYIMRGISSLELDHQTLMIHPGQMTVTYPGESHAVNGATTEKNQFLWIQLDLSKLGTAGVDLGRKLETKRLNLLHHAFDLEPAIRLLLRQVLGREVGFEQVAQVQVQLILALLAQRVEAAEQPPRVQSRPPSRAARTVRAPTMSVIGRDEPYSVEVGQAVRFLESHLDRRLSMVEIAGATTLSASHLYHRFRKEVGTSPHAYHLDLRLNAAKDALTHPDMSVVAVSQIFGFSSGQHFSAAFSKSFGVSPRDWRKRNGATPSRK